MFKNFFIQSDLLKLQVLYFYQLLLSLGIEPMLLALLAPCSTSWATEKLFMSVFDWCCFCYVEKLHWISAWAIPEPHLWPE